MTDPGEATVLDRAHAAVAEDAPEDAPERLALQAAVAEAELFLMLAEEPAGEAVRPRVFELEDGPVVLAFDSEARLARFAGGVVPYAALPGRRLVAMLAGKGVALGVNLEVAPSAMLWPAEAIDWLAEALAEAPREAVARPLALHAPSLPPGLVAALDARLARAAGLAREAWLAGVTHADGSAGHLLAVVGAAPGAEAVLVRSLGEAARFSGAAAGPLDIVCLAEGDALTGRLARVGLRFDLPVREAPAAPAAPGSDPARPPRLR